MKQLTIISENRVGILADICKILGHAGVNMESISAHGEGDKGIIRVVTSDPVTAEKLLKRRGYKLNVEDVIVVKIPNIPGELGKITAVIAREGINIESIYLMNKDKKHAFLGIRPSGDIDILKDMLKGYIQE